MPKKIPNTFWLTAVVDSEKGRNIPDSLKERHAFYSLVGVTNYLSYDYEDIPHTKLVQDGKIKNYYNLAAMPRAFIVHGWSVVNTPEEALHWMLNNPLSFGSEAVVEGTGIPAVAYLQEKSLATAKIKSYNLHSVEIEAETRSPGLLILTDTYHSDWRVTVDGKNENIFPADLCFRGVFLKPGKHLVKFNYFPKAFYICILVTFITLLIIFLLVFKELRKNAKHKKQSS